MAPISNKYIAFYLSFVFLTTRILHVCSVCPNDFELKPGAQNCTKCPIGYNTPDDGPHVCVCDYTRNHVKDQELDLCGCDTGYGYDSETGVCSLCPVNFQKTLPGAHACTAICRVDTFGTLQSCNTPSQMEYSAFSSVAQGADHTCAIRLPLRDVHCWPESHPAARHTPTFIRNATTLSLGKQHSCALWGVKKILTCWGKDVVHKNVVNVTEGVHMLAVGSPTSRHTCFHRMENLAISCIGDNLKGQLGLGAFGGTVANVAGDHVLQN